MSPWVQSTRAAAYYGPMSFELFVPDGWSYERWPSALTALLDGLRVKAGVVGANAVVGLEVTIDPFAICGGLGGLRMYVVGTAAKLEVLF